MSKTKIPQSQTGPSSDTATVLPTNVNGPVLNSEIEVLPASPPVPTVTEDFDLEAFRASPAPLVVAVDSGISAVRVRKPRGIDFVFVHPEWRMFAWIIPEDFKHRREAHLVLPSVAANHLDTCRKVLLVPYCGDDNNYYLWPIPQEDATGRINDYNKSAMQQISKAIGKWCQFKANMGNQSYNLFEARDQRDAPTWPPGGVEFLIKKAFEDRIIKTKDHPLLRQLRGRKVE
jgi:hypothetical protein